jgi:hypothetical protein
MATRPANADLRHSGLAGTFAVEVFQRILYLSVSGRRLADPGRPCVLLSQPAYRISAEEET